MAALTAAVAGGAPDPSLGNNAAVQTTAVNGPSGAATAPLVLVDDCGEIPTFVGGGPDAFQAP